MNVLYLGNRTSSFRFESVISEPVSEPVSEDELSWADFIVSYNYNHILSPEVCERFEGRAINLHISLLPWNRGTYPNVWSAIDGTPSGVSIHLIDKGIDTGDILAQRPVSFSDTDTLRTSHAKLTQEIESLFDSLWNQIKRGRLERTKQGKNGSYHSDRHLKTVILRNGWDTLLNDLRRDNESASGYGRLREGVV